jgi:hypothetical protein
VSPWQGNRQQPAATAATGLLVHYRNQPAPEAAPAQLGTGAAGPPAASASRNTDAAATAQPASVFEPRFNLFDPDQCVQPPTHAGVAPAAPAVTGPAPASGPAPTTQAAPQEVPDIDTGDDGALEVDDGNDNDNVAGSAEPVIANLVDLTNAFGRVDPGAVDAAVERLAFPLFFDGFARVVHRPPHRRCRQVRQVDRVPRRETQSAPSVLGPICWLLASASLFEALEESASHARSPHLNPCPIESIREAGADPSRHCLESQWPTLEDSWMTSSSSSWAAALTCSQKDMLEPSTP